VAEGSGFWPKVNELRGWMSGARQKDSEAFPLSFRVKHDASTYLITQPRARR
jgi:hypothetical protein